ncbi:hypothetical protein Q3Y49_14680 [Marivirga harenae]|nr:O-methyltransferase [Marivirga harenae]WKV11449.1 hypothetical protein Q3Y49_14680 [Marivirga harenae]
MFCELIQELSIFRNIKEYRYIGLGSTYFTDFSLIHKMLGIHKMISIEKDEENKNRFIFNKPYSCIEMKFSSTNEVLPTLDWNDPSIVWLDYDQSLDLNILKDIETCTANLKETSLLLMTVRAQHFQPQNKPDSNDELWKMRLDDLESKIGSERVPAGVTGEHLNLKKTAGVFREVITNEINKVLRDINGTNKSDSPDYLHYKQLVNITYQDGVKMLTLGGLIYSTKDVAQYTKSKIESLDFVRLSKEALEIKTPNLTFRELHILDSVLPNGIDLKTGHVINTSGTDGEKNLSSIIPISDIKKYAKIYRYFPTFAESNL